MALLTPPDNVPALYVESLAAWRAWLAEHHGTANAIWLAVYHQRSATPSVHWHEAIEHALCYGWVDSKAHKRDAESCWLKFTPRNPKSQWGPRNRERAQRLIAQGWMTNAGQRLIELAKATGRWENAGA